ncbi:MAG TPA: RDD family protein [Candidatus Dormibacteraeota bacterium]|nr:RDD family protein [Candidatus Dormibacteraeota bacterium]
MISWDGDRVSTSDSVAVDSPLSGAALRDSYAEAVGALTLGLARWRENAVRVGPLVMLRFGEPQVGPNFVEWPIEGGLLAHRGGHWRIEAKDGKVEATAEHHRPAIPRPIYDATHLQLHQLLTHLYLLRVRGASPSPGADCPPEDRFRAAAVDVAFCLTLTGLTGRRRTRRALLIAAAYHVACWSLTGRTLGGLVMRERVVAIDGSRPTVTQSMFRLALLPLSWIVSRPVHDELAATRVIRD